MCTAKGIMAGPLPGVEITVEVNKRDSHSAPRPLPVRESLLSRKRFG